MRVVVVEARPLNNTLWAIQAQRQIPVNILDIPPKRLESPVVAGPRPWP
jgi:hypothetical protein